jgi:hypothetical protein
LWFLAYTGDLGKKRLGRGKLTIKTVAGGRSRRQEQAAGAGDRKKKAAAMVLKQFRVQALACVAKRQPKG